MSNIDTLVAETDDSWVHQIRYTKSTGRLVIVTDRLAKIEYQVPEWKYWALLERATTKRNKQGEISVGSAVNEFIGENCDFNIKGAREAAEATVAQMSALERQSTWMALVNHPNLHGLDS